MTIQIPMVPLSEVLTRSEEWITLKPDERYREVTVRLWGKGVVQRREVTGAEIASTRRLLVRSQQFILSRIDARNGAFGLVPDSLDGAIVSNDFPVFNPNRSRILPGFLHWMSKTRSFINLCKAASEGTTNRVRLVEERFFATEIPVPPLVEQRRIVARIEELATKIEEARRLRREAAEEATALVSSLHISLAKGRTVRLGDILALDELREEVRFGCRYPQVGVKGFGQGLFERETLDATQTTYKAFNRLYEGALVLSQVKGWEGAIAVCPPDLAGRYVSPEYRTFRCIPGKALSEYLSVVVTNPWFWTRLSDVTRGVGARRERTRPEQFLRLELPMPRIEEQSYALPVFAKLERLKHFQAETAAELDALLPSILDKAFRGEL